MPRCHETEARREWLFVPFMLAFSITLLSLLLWLGLLIATTASPICASEEAVMCRWLQGVSLCGVGVIVAVFAIGSGFRPV